MDNWFDLLMAGTFRDSKGKDVTITDADLDNIVSSYDPANFAAALTLGHPQSQKEPAYGWVKAIKRVGDKILFQPHKIVTEFARAVKEKMFPRVSAGLEKVGDSWTLNHIAFLGAWKPAVPGLEEVEFAANDNDTIETELADWKGEAAEFADADVVNWVEGRFNSIAAVLNKVREYIIDKDGVDKADKFVSSWDTEYIGSPAPDFVENPQSGLSAPGAGDGADPDYKALLAASEQEKAHLTTELGTAVTRVSELEGVIKKGSLESVRAEFAAYIDTQINDRRMLAPEKEFAVNTLVALSKAELASSADHDINTPEVVAYKKHIEARPQSSLTREVAVDGRGENTMSVAELVSCAQDHVSEMAAKGQKVSYADAVGFVKDNPEKFKKQV